jgi:hypothetical protein
MKTRTPWWPLLRNELLFDRFPIVPWVLGGAYCLVASFAFGWIALMAVTRICGGDIVVFFNSSGEIIVALALFWLFFALILAGMSTVPGTVRWETYEFYFTRAIARRSLFRAKTMVLFAALLGPLILNMLLALRTPDLVLKTDMSPGVTGFGSYWPDPKERLDSYMRAFPGAHPNPGARPETVRPELARQEVHELVLPRATLVYAGWLLWGGTLGLLAMQIYCALMASRVTRRFWPVVIFAGLPFLPAGIVLANYGDRTSAFLERSFLFFATHEAALALAAAAAIPLVQWWAERRFSELEIS